MNALALDVLRAGCVLPSSSAGVGRCLTRAHNPGAPGSTPGPASSVVADIAPVGDPAGAAPPASATPSPDPHYHQKGRSDEDRRGVRQGQRQSRDRSTDGREQRLSGNAGPASGADVTGLNGAHMRHTRLAGFGGSPSGTSTRTEQSPACAASTGSRTVEASSSSVVCADEQRSGVGLENPAEMREDRLARELAARPLCSRCHRAPVSDGRSVLCLACVDRMINLAADAECGEEAWRR